MHRVISHYNKLRMVEDISMDGKDKLETSTKKIQKEENMTWLSSSLIKPLDSRNGCGEVAWSKEGSRKAARVVTMTTRWGGGRGGTNTAKGDITSWVIDYSLILARNFSVNI